VPPADTAPLASRLALGTAQFGLAYGISHDGGAVPTWEVEDILVAARDAGIAMLDTAAAYGESESVLGQLGHVSSAFEIVTKTLPIRSGDLTSADLTAIDGSFRRSLARLKRERVGVLLAHEAADLLAENGDRLWALMDGYRAEGLTGRIGVSAYDASQIAAVLDRFPVEVVQLPINVFDQRLIEDGTLGRLAGRGIEIHARSLILQGLLLMTEAEVASRLPRALPAFRRWHVACANANVMPLTAALGFGLARPEIARLVIGVHSHQHLAECLTAAKQALTSHRPQLDWPRLACNDPDIVDPRRWNWSTTKFMDQAHQPGHKP
jgi:aryl-alcohol dehydrogenase-like predicted oxidoreductase